MTKWQRRAPDHYLVQSDTGAEVSDALVDGAGAAVDLTGAAVKYLLWAPGAASAQINAAATVGTPATDGIVSFTPNGSQSSLVGDFIEEWQVTFAGGAIQTFPQTGPHKVRIRKEVGS